ncbi:MAG: DUF1289 domain-containing protein [Zoogloeaceae bacterium]|nr:DUF1289 domain-containing protein [Zoogloeaceae bacterium]
MRELNRPIPPAAAEARFDDARIESPCIRQCCIDEATGLCAGCCRTLNEICGWSGFDAADKLRVLAAIEARRIAKGQAR